LRYHCQFAMNWFSARLPACRFTLLLFCLIPVAARGQEVESIYGPLPVFEFHSGFWVNLHHFLYHEARARQDAKSAAGPTAKPGPVLKQSPVTATVLTAAEQKTWDEAIAYYTANYVNKDMQVNIDLILLKNQLGDFEDCNELLGKKRRSCDAGLPGNIGVILEAAAPIYRAHWWVDHDRANRRWVLRVAPLVREQGVGLSEHLAAIYQARWPKEKIRVDVSAYANQSGAYTSLDPLRVTIASTESRNQGPQALEVLFLEASHDIAQPVESAISRECKQRDKPIPRDLWHALILYTTSEVIQPVLDSSATTSTDSLESGESGSLPRSKPKFTGVTLQMLAEFKQRGWDGYLLLLTMYWQPYLDEHVTFEDAIAHLVSAA
jgi:hypothetical protein